MTGAGREDRRRIRTAQLRAGLSTTPEREHDNSAMPADLLRWAPAALLRKRESGILIALIALCVLISAVTPKFMSSYNLSVVVRQVSFVGIVAAGQTLVLLLGGIDLSVGAIAGLTAVLGAGMMTILGVNPFVAMLLAMLLGFAFGLVNGFMIARMKLNAFIVTLATGEVFAGAILVLTRGYSITGIPGSFAILGQGYVGPVPVPVLFMMAVYAILAFVCSSTPFGRSLFAIGGNRDAAQFVGLRVERVEMFVYAIAGMLAALAGMLFVSSRQCRAAYDWSKLAYALDHGGDHWRDVFDRRRGHCLGNSNRGSVHGRPGQRNRAYERVVLLGAGYHRRFCDRRRTCGSGSSSRRHSRLVSDLAGTQGPPAQRRIGRLRRHDKVRRIRLKEWLEGLESLSDQTVRMTRL